MQCFLIFSPCSWQSIVRSLSCTFPTCVNLCYGSSILLIINSRTCLQQFPKCSSILQVRRVSWSKRPVLSDNGPEIKENSIKRFSIVWFEFIYRTEDWGTHKLHRNHHLFTCQFTYKNTKIKLAERSKDLKLFAKSCSCLHSSLLWTGTVKICLNGDKSTRTNGMRSQHLGCFATLEKLLRNEFAWSHPPGYETLYNHNRFSYFAINVTELLVTLREYKRS